MEVPQQAATGIKYDQGKSRWDLLPWDEVRDVADVFTYGSVKYGDRNWEKGIDDSRLFAALMRHVTAVLNGDENDAESGMPHLAHAAANILMWLNNRKKAKKSKK